VNPEYRDKALPYITDTERQQQLVERHRHGQKMQPHTVHTPGRPEHEPGDIRAWWGGKRESLLLQRHHARMDGIYYAARQAAYIQEAMLALDYHSYVSSTRTIAAEEQELMTTDPNSLTAQVAEQMLLDSVERIRIATNDIQADFRRRTIGHR